jgi:hypothetical protein
VKLENVQEDVIMSISSVPASNQVNLAALFAPSNASPKHAERGNRDSSGDGNSQGITLLASLLQALVQAATQPAAAATPSASGTAAAGTAATVGTSSAAATTGAAAATSSPTSTTGATAATSTSTTGTSAATGTTTGTTGATSTTNLVADLQAFLHDLFSALRQAGRSDHGGREHELWREQGATSAATTPSTSAPASSTTTGSTTAPASSATPATTSGAVTATTSSPAAAGSTTPVAVPANPTAGAYGPRNIISELKVLVQDLSNGQASSSTGASDGVSQRRLSNLNAAFEKLISDLSGTASAAVTTSTAGAAASTSTTDTAAASTSTTAPSPTSALQAFLTNFAQDLQNNGEHSLNPVGSSVNTTA